MEIHCQMKLAEVFDLSGHIRIVIVQYTTLQDYSIGCKLTSLNHNHHILKEEVEPLRFHIKFKGKRNIPSRSIMVFKHTVLNLNNKPQNLHRELRYKFRSKLAEDITERGLKMLPIIILGVDNTHIHPLWIGLPEDIRVQYPKLDLYQSKLMGKLLILLVNRRTRIKTSS